MATKVIPLEAIHDVKHFDCGNNELNMFLQTTAAQHQRKSISKTYVLIDDDAPTRVIGFYTLALRKMVPRENLPFEVAKKMPREVPGFSLARLAVDSHFKAQHHGEYLLTHALNRAALVAREIGGYAIFVDAKDVGVANFYKKYGFTPFPDDPLILCLPFKDIPI